MAHKFSTFAGFEVRTEKPYTSDATYVTIHTHLQRVNVGQRIALNLEWAKEHGIALAEVMQRDRAGDFDYFEAHWSNNIFRVRFLHYASTDHGRWFCTPEFEDVYGGGLSWDLLEDVREFMLPIIKAQREWWRSPKILCDAIRKVHKGVRFEDWKPNIEGRSYARYKVEDKSNTPIPDVEPIASADPQMRRTEREDGGAVAVTITVHSNGHDKADQAGTTATLAT